MQRAHCPICYSLLEVRTVTPCFICGGWPDHVERFNPAKPLREYQLPSGLNIVLCSGCEVEEFMVEGGYGWQLELPTGRLPINYLSWVSDLSEPEVGLDKYCNQCNLRLAFLKILAKGGSNAAD
jgi:hypothetical protein